MVGAPRSNHLTFTTPVHPNSSHEAADPMHAARMTDTRISERVVRDLHPSDSLLRALERCAKSTIEGVVGERVAKPVIDLPQLVRLEDALGTRLHDDVITLVALGDPLAKCLTGIECTLTIETAADDFDAPDGYVCIAAVYSEPIGELQDGSHGGPHYELMVPRSRAGDDATLRVHIGKAFDAEMDLGTFIERMLSAASARGARGIAPERGTNAGQPRPVPLEPRPRIIPGLTVVRAPLLRALHKKFGEGTVLRRIEDGAHEKLVIAFADRERTLLASYVEILK